MQLTDHESRAITENMALPKITRRELELMSQIRTCAPNKIIAANMGLTYGSVKTLLSLLMKKLGCANRMEVANYRISQRHIEDMPGFRALGLFCSEGSD